jgi:predicted nucleotidyltransferase
MNEKFDELVRRLVQAHGEELVSVVLHGSAVVTGRATKPSDYRVLVVITTLPVEVLRRTKPVAEWWVGQGFQLPVYFTLVEFNDSLDVFPIEFRQVKRAYCVLHGRDLLKDAEISSANLRWQIEHELRGKLLRLRGLYLPASESAESLTNLMTDSVVTFIQFFRSILELLDEEPPLERQVVIARLGERLNFETAPLERVLRLRHEPVSLLEPEAQDLFADYLNCLARVITAVDRIM